MKKTMLMLILFLAVGVTLNAQAIRVTRHAVGTGGFISNTTSIGKMSGLFGQAMTGKLQPTIDGKQHTMYLGFWSPIPSGTSVEDYVLQRGIYNYPNPVSDATSFNFTLSEPSLVTIRIYNSLGSLVATVTDNEMRSDGTNSIEWNIRNANVDMLSSGTYWYDMIAVPLNSKSKPVSYRNTIVISK
jgi:hypothetical protein